MRNLSKTMMSKKVTLIIKETIMKTIIVTIIMAVSMTFAAHANAATDAVELFVSNIPGITDQDIRMCQDSYSNGGRYFHRIYNATLECSQNHISVDFDHSED